MYYSTMVPVSISVAPQPGQWSTWGWLLLNHLYDINDNSLNQYGKWLWEPNTSHDNYWWARQRGHWLAFFHPTQFYLRSDKNRPALVLESFDRTTFTAGVGGNGVIVRGDAIRSNGTNEDTDGDELPCRWRIMNELGRPRFLEEYNWE